MSDSKHPEGPSLRELARMAGVSTMTVSRALDGSRYVRAEVREKILKLAEENGYRPDPQFRKLMQYLRRSRGSRLRGGICSVESKEWLGAADSYCRRVLNGARARAGQLGFAWHTYSWEDLQRRPQAFARKLYQWGVDGVFLPPVPRGSHIPEEVDWNGLSVVCTSYSILSPVFTRVVPNHFRNMLRVCDCLYARGYRRIGLLRGADLVRAQLQFYSAIAGFCLERGLKLIHPLTIEEGGYRVENARLWFEREKPDVLIVNGDVAAAVVARDLELEFPGPVAMVSTDCASTEWSGTDQVPASVGSLAVDALSGMVIHGEKGLPQHPTVVMVEGRWQDGTLQSARGPEKSSTGAA